METLDLKPPSPLPFPRALCHHHLDLHWQEWRDWAVYGRPRHPCPWGGEDTAGLAAVLLWGHQTDLWLRRTLILGIAAEGTARRTLQSSPLLTGACDLQDCTIPTTNLGPGPLPFMYTLGLCMFSAGWEQRVISLLCVHTLNKRNLKIVHVWNLCWRGGWY